jgi:hypothetical protein
MASTTELLAPPLERAQASPAVLLNHPTQSAVAINGWGSVLFAVPFMAAGIGIGLVALNTIHARKQAPDWLIGGIGAMFFLSGLFFFVHGLLGVARRSAWLREMAEHPHEPWLYDHHWRREGIAFSAFDTMVERLLAAVVWTAFLAPFAWVGLNVKGAWPFLVAVGIFGLCGLIFWFRWAAMLLDLLRYGNSYLSFESFPFFMGGTLRARLRAPHHVSTIDSLAFTLRCVQERYVTTGVGQNRSTKVICYELYKEVSTFGRDRLTGLAGGDIPIEFHLPSDQPTTNLAATPPIYWEIEAKGTARGADYEAFFLVPVYKES